MQKDLTVILANNEAVKAIFDFCNKVTDPSYVKKLKETYSEVTHDTGR